MSRNKLTPRNLTMPFAAGTMAILLFVYTRTSIQAAKTNAAMHREADGGQISWRNQSLRQHGQLPAPTPSASHDSGGGGENKDDGRKSKSKSNSGSLVVLDGAAGSVPKEDGKGGVKDIAVISATEERIREKVLEMKGGRR